MLSAHQLALYVLSFLEPRDLLHAAQTCRYWRLLAEDNLLWREKCREESIDDMLVYGSKVKRKTGNNKGPWKSLYMRQKQIEHNWRASPLRPPKVSAHRPFSLVSLKTFSTLEASCEKLANCPTMCVLHIYR